ncbi:hypothetical protein [Poseidonocella sedimentorum]|uniref:Phage protein D n=1 Tax=Poseidonocella sedimentorum TaxID=871652 RepID=A0A1I6DPH2_9RHOB|nr:hypothetical protein [Poseidonocella sedimentorum]SFR07258.1 hypothetical protein SAMN04515673_104202 [Poseidonocella sedimentorum]
MTSGAHTGAELRLHIGPAVPIPVGEDVMKALVSASVTSATAEAPGVFQLVFEIDQNSPLMTVFMLSGGAPIPMIRVVISARVNGSDSVLMDGVMTNHEVSPGPAPGSARLTVTGEDMSRVLDYIAFREMIYPASPDFARVGLILAKYAFLGIIPKVIPSVLLDVPLPTSRIPHQQGKDLAYIRKLADDVGYIFRMEPGPEVGMSFAYWGPEIPMGEVQPPLDFDMDAAKNLTSASGGFNTQDATLPIVVILNPETKVPIPIPTVANPLLNPPLGAIPPIPLQITPITDSAKYNPVQGALIGMAKAAQINKAPMKVSGQLDVIRYGRLLKPHKLVSLRGFGAPFNGLHYAAMVRTDFAPGSLTQNFELTRNGVLSTVEKVPA